MSPEGLKAFADTPHRPVLPATIRNSVAGTASRPMVTRSVLRSTSCGLGVTHAVLAVDSGQADLLRQQRGVPEGRDHDQLVVDPLGGLAELDIERLPGGRD